MPRDATGTYTLPLAPFVPNTLAKAGDVNTQLSDLAAGLTDSWSRSNPSPAQGDLNMNGHNITGLDQVIGPVSATGYIEGARVFAYLNAPAGGAVYSASASWAAGFATASDGYIHWGDVGSDGTVITSRLSLGPSGDLNATGSISGTAITGTGAVTGASLSTAGNVNAATVTGTNITASGTVTGANVTGTTITATGTVSGATVSGTNVTASGAISGASLTTTGGITSNSGTVSGVVSARGPGVAYPNISALGSGQAHSFGFDYAGPLSLYVDGAFVGHIALTARTDSLDDRLTAIEARLSALGG